jgi:uncharacterized protein (DUF2141 family)
LESIGLGKEQGGLARNGTKRVGPVFFKDAAFKNNQLEAPNDQKSATWFYLD